MRFRFADFELDPGRAELRQQGRPVRVEPQVLEVLALLVARADQLVTRDELVAAVWGGRPISDAAIASRVKSARQVLGDDGGAQRFIRTVHGRGYRFVVPVAQPDAQPSLAVLPFRLQGEAPGFAVLAEALPDELIADLARLRWLLVVARGSSFRVDPRSDPQDLCRRLGVRFVLGGALELRGASLACRLRLVEGAGGQVIWAETFQGRIDELAALQEELRSKVAAALELRIPLHEAQRARGTVGAPLDAWGAYHLGLQHLYRYTRADGELAAGYFDRAVALDPQFARAHAGRSFVHFQAAFLQHAPDRRAAMSAARRCAERAMECDPLDPFAHFTLGRSHWLEGDLDGAVAWLERSTQLCPNYAQGYYARALMETLSGQIREGREHVERALRLSPLDPLHYAMLGTRAFACLGAEDWTGAGDWAERAARAPGAHVLIAMLASAAQQLSGRHEAAALWAREVQRRSSGLRTASFFESFPLRSERLRGRIDGALRQLGYG